MSAYTAFLLTLLTALFLVLGVSPLLIGALDQNLSESPVAIGIGSDSRE